VVVEVGVCVNGGSVLPYFDRQSDVTRPISTVADRHSSDFERRAVPEVWVSRLDDFSTKLRASITDVERVDDANQLEGCESGGGRYAHDAEGSIARDHIRLEDDVVYGQYPVATTIDR
jgi:hypothetical protein